MIHVLVEVGKSIKSVVEGFNEKSSNSCFCISGLSLKTGSHSVNGNEEQALEGLLEKVVIPK